MTALLTLGASGAWADGLKVSTTESASAEYQYKIFCRNASTYYLGNTTNATNSGADYGLFAFFADNSGDYTNGYYIYSIFEGKWVTYTAAEGYSEGKNKISLVTDKPSVPWNIAADDTNNKYYDIRPFKTDKTVANMSWNWHGGTTANTSNTMGFYGYTDGNSGWGIVLAGGSGSPVADRKVVALYNRVTSGDEYPITPNSGVVVAGSTDADAQLFVLKHNGIDANGEAQYHLMKAEADGNYLRTPDVPTSNAYGTSATNYFFINSSCTFIANYTKTNSEFATSPYYNLIASNGSYRSLHSQNKGENMNGWTTNSPNIYVQYGAKGTWNNLWNVKEQAYTAWQVVLFGATSGTVTYSGSSLISGGTATQSNNGMFVLSATPSASDFTASVVDGYLTDPAVTIDSNRKIIKVVYTNYSETYNTIVTKLSTAPEGVGYPTTTARTRLQAAIDVFDASSKETADLATLNTAYTSFLTNVVLPEGKVYTIQNYIKSNSLTTYLKNEDGTLTIGADASATPLNNLWIVRKSGNTYVLQSAADPTKYIVYNNFTLNATGSPWTLSSGTEWPYISMYNSSLGGGRYVACNGSNQFGTAGGNNYYANPGTQSSSGWSTDFKFVESPDYALYKVKIIYPQGSAPTVTYSGNDYANGSDFVAPTTLTTGDLTVSTISGYTPTVTIDGDIIYVYYDMAVAAPYTDTWNFDTAPWSLLNDAPAAIDNPNRTYRYNTKRINIATTYNSSVEVVFAYTAGKYRIDVAGVDLIDPSTGNVVKGDYHDGYSGTAQSNKEYSIRDVAPGEYILRYISYGQSTSSAGNISVRVVPGQGFYRLKNVATDKYLTATATGAWNSSTRGVYANGSNTVASTVIRLFDKDSNGKLYMYNQGYGFGWTSTTDYGGHVGWITNIPDKYVNWFPGTSAGQIAFAICLGDGTGDYADYLTKGIYTVDTNDNAVIAGSDYTDNKAQWVLEAASSVTIPLSGAIEGKSYGTFSAPFDVTIGDDAKAYTVELSGERAVYTEVADKKVPAGAGVLLISETAASSVTATINTGDAFETLSDNDLVGYNLASTFSYEGDTWNLVLGNSATSGIGFYKMNGTASANKAYLPYSHVAGTSVKGFSLVAGDEVDGIQSIDIEQTNAPIFNLAGQRVQKVQRGLYIIGGKKVIVK